MPKINSKYFNAMDVREGDQITFKDGGKLVTKTWGTVIEITIEIPDGSTRLFSLKGKNYKTCAEGFGSKDTDNWVGRQAIVHVFPNQLVAGKTTTIVQLEPITEIQI